MPNIERHSKSTRIRYGIEAKDFHHWIDEPLKVCGASHRKYRHKSNIMIPQEFVFKYGEEMCRNVLLDHIVLDNVTKGMREGRSVKDENVVEKETRYEQITRLFYENPKRTYGDIEEVLGIEQSTIGVIVGRCKRRGYLPRIPKEQWTKELIRNCLIENEIAIEGIT